MALQTYLVRCRSGGDLEMIKRVVLQVRGIGGVVLMATREGGVIAAFDDTLVERVRRWLDVDFVGGVTLDPNGPAAEQLSRIFANYIAVQMAGPASSGIPGAAGP